MDNRDLSRKVRTPQSIELGNSQASNWRKVQQKIYRLFWQVRVKRWC